MQPYQRNMGGRANKDCTRRPPGSEARLSASQQRKDTEGGHSGPKDKSSSVPKRLWQETAQERDAALVSLKEAVDAAKKEAKLREEAERRTLQVQKDMARLQDGCAGSMQAACPLRNILCHKLCTQSS